ncbi:hypothetical protein MTO96_015740 [Rhipicephalus appendiculatus]
MHHHRQDNAVPNCHGTISECVFCCVFLTAFSTAVALDSSPTYNAVGARHHPASVYTSSACDDCAARKLAEQANSAEYRYARIELIKQQILKKLRLKEPPNVRRPRSVLPSVLADKDLLPAPATPAADDERNSRSRDDFYGTMQTAVIFPHNDSNECVSRSPHLGSCFVFHLSNELTRRSVAHAELWVFKDLDPSSSTSACQPHLRRVRAVRLRLAPQQPASPPPSNDAAQAGRRLREQFPETRMAEVRPDEPRRAVGRTSQQPSSGPGDQLQDVRQPEEHPALGDARRFERRQAALPRGDRLGQLDHTADRATRQTSAAARAYTTSASTSTTTPPVLQRFLHSAAAGGVNDTLKLSLCCTPSRLSSISLIFIDEDQVLKQKSLPNMVVEACECA